MCRGVSPDFVLAFTSQTPTSLTVLTECFLQAMCSGNFPSSFWMVKLQRFLETRNFTSLWFSQYEVEERARWRGVSPVAVTAFKSHSHSSIAIFKLPLVLAMCNGNSPFWFCMLASHFLVSVRYFTIFILFSSQAMCSGVFPSVVWELMSQLLSSSTSSIDHLHARWRGSCPSLSGTLWLQFIVVVRYFTVFVADNESLLIFFKATCSGVSPDDVTKLGLWTYSPISFTVCRLRLRQAMCKGVSPSAFWTSGLHFFCSSRYEILWKLGTSQAKCNAVSPVEVCILGSQLLTSFTILRGACEHATCRASSPFLFWMLGSAQFNSSSKHCTVFGLPFLQAMCRGVSPDIVLEFTSQFPADFKTLIDLALVAKCNGVSPSVFCIAISHFFSSTRYFTTWTAPCLQATCNGVFPAEFFTFGSQLLTSFVRANDCFSQAICKARFPEWFWILGSALVGASSTRNFAISKHFLLHATCSGVFPHLSL